MAGLFYVTAFVGVAVSLAAVVQTVLKYKEQTKDINDYINLSEELGRAKEKQKSDYMIYDVLHMIDEDLMSTYFKLEVKALDGNYEGIEILSRDIASKITSFEKKCW